MFAQLMNWSHATALAAAREELVKLAAMIQQHHATNVCASDALFGETERILKIRDQIDRLTS